MAPTVLGIGMSSSATLDDVRAAATAALHAAGVDWPDVTAIATVSALAADHRLQLLGPPVVGFDAGRLAAVNGVTASPRVLAATGTSSVAEAAALLGAGPDSRLVIPKQRAGAVTVAVARP